jgi:prepilin-type N-terminal cleavage/methylation domain-containing protein
MRLKTDQRGLTLIEVLVAIVVLGIIILPLGNAMIGFIRLSDQTTQHMTESHDAQIAAAYLAQDVQSLGVRDWAAYPYPYRQSVELNVAGTAGLYPCGDAGSQAVLRLAWDDPDTVSGPPRVIRAAYVVSTVGSERHLDRLLCAGSATAVSDTVIAHDLDPTMPTVTCSTSCVATPVPATVSLSIAVRDPRDGGPAYTVVLTGQRRQT